MDASSIRGWAQIHESDMLLIPDPNTAFMDPFLEAPTLVMICDVQDPPTRKPYPRDVRNLAHRAEEYLQKSGIADQAFFGAEAEFFILDNVRFDSRENYSYYYVDSDEGRWNSGREMPGQPNLGFPSPLQGRLFPCSSHRSLSGYAQRDGSEAWQRSAWRSSVTTTKSPPPASAKLTSNSTR